MSNIMCPRCAFDTMANIQPCKLRCENCAIVFPRVNIAISAM